MEAINAIVCAATAFNTWGEMVKAMADGYVPTIHPSTRRKRLLMALLTAKGWNHFPHNNVK